MEYQVVPDRDPDWVRPAYRFAQRLITGIFKLLFGLRIEGRENVPRTGPFILVSNHQSWFDPPIIGASCPREIFYAAKQELFTTPVLGKLVRFYNSIPVRRTGFDRRALVSLGNALEAGFGIIIFPEGTRYLSGELHPPRPGVGMLAVRYHAQVVPVFITGSSYLRRQIYGRKLRVRFGKPFMVDVSVPDRVEQREVYRRAADEVMRHIARTGGVKPPEPIAKRRAVVDSIRGPDVENKNLAGK